jgi:Calcineurin-like phosphoesterase
MNADKRRFPKKFLSAFISVHLRLILIFCATAATPPRDWQKLPAVVEIDTSSPVFAVGDVHGDYARLIRLLQSAQVVDARVHWIAGKSVLVFTGDMIDKGPRPVDVLRLIQTLEEEAAHDSGRVVPLMGNHEAEFLASPDPQKAADFLADLEAHHLPASAFNSFLAGLPMAARINGWFFCHAGNTAGRTLPQLKSDLETGVTRDGFRSTQLLGPDSLLEARLGTSGTWFASRDERQLLATYAHSLNAQHIVQGHQHNDVKFAGGVERHTGEIFQRYGLLFLIDVGMSEGVGDSEGAILRIQSGAADAVCPDGRVTRLWDAETHQDTGRALCR